MSTLEGGDASKHARTCARARALCQAFGSRAHRVGHRDGQPTVIRELLKAIVTGVVVVVVVVVVLVVLSDQRLIVLGVVVLGAISSRSRRGCKRLRKRARCPIFLESFVTECRGWDSCRRGRGGDLHARTWCATHG